MIWDVSEDMKRRSGAMSGEVLSRISRHLVRCYFSRFFAWSILAYGIYLRIRQYGFNRSLWFDEALIGTYIAKQSFTGFLHPLPWYGVDPIGFLWILKCSVMVFGNYEYALRLFPLLCGLAACVVFYKIAKKCLIPVALPLALILFSFSDKLIYYASEAKPYSGDVLVALLIYLAALVYQPRRSVLKWLAIGGLGIIGPWFSYPSVFVMATVVMVLFFKAVREKRWKPVLAVLMLSLTIASGFLIYYFYFLQRVSDNGIMQRVWAIHFGTLISRDIGQLLGSLRNIQILLFNMIAGGKYVDLSVIAAATGLMVFFKQSRKNGLIFLMPIILAYLASTIGKYPFAGRLILFYVPVFYCLIAQGAAHIWHCSLRNGYPLLGIVFAGLLLSCPLQNGMNRFSHPQEREEIRPVLDHIGKYYQPGDGIYVYYGAIPAFNYYTKVWAGRGRYRWKPSRVCLGVGRSGSPWAYQSDIASYRYEKRVWFLFAHTDIYCRFEEKKLYLDYLSITAKQIDADSARQASVFLYDLSASPSS